MNWIFKTYSVSTRGPVLCTLLQTRLYFCTFMSTAVWPQVRCRKVPADCMPGAALGHISSSRCPHTLQCQSGALRGLKRVGGFHAEWLTRWGVQSSWHKHPIWQQEGIHWPSQVISLCRLISEDFFFSASDISSYCSCEFVVYLKVIPVLERGQTRQAWPLLRESAVP